MEEELGIYREEVLVMIGRLPTSRPIRGRSSRSSAATRRTTMKRRKKTPEEIRAWREAREARIRELHWHMEKIRNELAARRKPDPA